MVEQCDEDATAAVGGEDARMQGLFAKKKVHVGT